MKTLETAYIRARASILRSSGISIQETSELLQRSERWVKIRSSRGDFEDKPRTGGPAVLSRTAKILIEKAKYERDNSTRGFARQLASKGRAGSIAMVWRYMSKKKDGNLSDVKRTTVD